MATTSAQTLSEKLEQRKQHDNQAEQNRIQQLLDQHESSLRQLSESALTTTSAITASQQEQLSTALKANLKLVSDSKQQISDSLNQIDSELNTLSQQTNKRLLMMMSWPLIMTVVCCILMTGSATLYAWQTVKSAQDETKQILEVQQYKLKQLNMEFCSGPAGVKYCNRNK